MHHNWASVTEYSWAFYDIIHVVDVGIELAS